MAIPAMALSPDGNIGIQRRPAIQWVDNNMRKIAGRAVKFQRYSPYDLQDFVQQAYVTAIVAEKVSESEGINFEACFWTLYTADCRSMGSNPATRDCFQEYTEDYSERGDAPTSPRDMRRTSTERGRMGKEQVEKIETLIDIALQVMTQKQREVWRYLLADSYYTTLDVAELLQIKRQAVEALREGGLKRVRRHFKMAHAIKSVPRSKRSSGW